MIIDFAAKIKAKLPSSIQLHHLRLQETATSFAEWFAADQDFVLFHYEYTRG
jgi:6-pyruvoyltetrahydropterin/6-carboxytetrahydropterin synthase